MENKFKNPVKLQQTCVSCGKTFETTVEKEDIGKFLSGTFAQDAFPYLDAGTRELFFISNICNSCWKSVCGSEE